MFANYDKFLQRRASEVSPVCLGGTTNQRCPLTVGFQQDPQLISITSGSLWLGSPQRTAHCQQYGKYGQTIKDRIN